MSPANVLSFPTQARLDPSLLAQADHICLAAAGLLLLPYTSFLARHHGAASPWHIPLNDAVLPADTRQKVALASACGGDLRDPVAIYKPGSCIFCLPAGCAALWCQIWPKQRQQLKFFV